MPFLPLFIVIALFVAGSKILQPSDRQYLRPASEDYEDQLLNRALIDYIARESATKSYSQNGSKSRSKFGKRGSRAQQWR